MFDAILFAVNLQNTWYLFPLAAVISLVYSASRYELPDAIVKRAARLFVTILVFMTIVLGVLVVLSWNL